MDGILVIDKPAGPTSHDVVSMVKRAVGARKVGHLGTLDPAATGVLPLCLNGATKKASELSGGDKIYSFTIVLGTTTETDDAEGKILTTCEVCDDHRARVADVLPQFIGTIDQVPPIYSAKKVKGKRLYKLARKGLDVKPEPRTVMIHELTIESIEENNVNMKVRCAPGTYVRALCRDIGAALGCGGHATNIRRLQSGRFTIEQAISLGDVSTRWREQLMPL